MENFCRKSEAIGENPRFFPIKPVDAGVAPQPRELALGILAGAELDLVDGLLARGRGVDCVGRDDLDGELLERREAVPAVEFRGCVL